jgi:predicted lipid-binding transport protein (Tim44 family)
MTRVSRLLAVASAAILVAATIATAVDARPSSGGSRGSRTFSAPAATPTAPNAAAPIQRTQTQPGTAVTRPATTPGAATAQRPGGLFGGGMLGGLAAGFIGAGLLGLLFGHGLLGGLGGLASILGLILQVGLVVIVARLLWVWWQRRQQPAVASGPSMRDSMNTGHDGNGQGGGSRGGLGGFGLGGLGGFGGQPQPAQAGERSDEIGIVPADYDRFERVLTEIQTGFGAEDQATLRDHSTPEMFGYFQEDLQNNASQGVVNRISDVKLLQGDLAEAWREGDDEYATVAMRYSLVDKIIDRASGRVVDGGDHPQEVTEAWTFVRHRGGPWVVSAIQQV